MNSRASVKLELEAPPPPQIRAELLAASDAQIDEAVKFTDPMALRGLLYQLTGDESIAATAVAKTRVFFADAYTPATAQDVELIQAKAAQFLKRYRDGGGGPLGYGPPDRLPQSLALTAGEEIADAEIDMWIEETALDPWARALVWRAPPPPEKLRAFSVVVIGIGLGGIAAAVQLKHAGIPFTVIERNSEVGGTWYENRYPGARVDTPSRAYTHIFGADFVFDHPFSPQSDNERYFNAVVDAHSIREHVIFDTEVESITWNESTHRWKILSTGPQGRRTTEANAVISATGIFARPNIPKIPGIGDFRGPSFHTARWLKDLDLKGKRVAVVGTGATGYQLVPELADLAGHVHLFQRKPQWVFPVPGYRHPLPKQLTWLDRNLPYHINFMRFRTNWLTGQHVYAEIFNQDPAFVDEFARSALNKEIRDARIAYINEKFADHPEIAAKMVPPHPPFSSRPILVDAAYNIYDAILRDDVTLVTEGVERITANGIVAKGVEYPVDIIVFATGFRANDLLAPMQIFGRGGRRVEDFWAHDGARAYVNGSMMPGFPNFFMLYGPNTNPANGGGIVNHEEMVVRFALECVEELILEDKKSIEVCHEAFRKYNEELDKREALKIYTDRRAQTYFMNEHARSSIMSPFAPSEQWNRLRPVRFEDFIIE